MSCDELLKVLFLNDVERTKVLTLFISPTPTYGAQETFDWQKRIAADNRLTVKLRVIERLEEFRIEHQRRQERSFYN